MRPNRVFGLCRVSGAEQGRHGTSLAAQRQTIENYCARLGYPAPTVRVEVESAAPEKLERRTELAWILREAQPGDKILVALVDRWSRDLVFAVDSVRKLVARGIGWVAIDDGIDASTHEGDSSLGMRAWAADEERKRIRRRTVGRREELKDLGYYVEGPVSFGYRRGPRAQGLQRTLVIEPEEARIVREAWRMCLRRTIKEIVAWLRTVTDRYWDGKSVGSMLENRLYLGEVKNSKGHWLPSKHVPEIITPELFRKAQEARRSRDRRGPKATKRVNHWLLRGMATCAKCGSRMSAQFGCEPAPWGFYACSKRIRHHGCDAGAVRVRAVDPLAEKQTLEHLSGLRAEIANAAPKAEEERLPDFANKRRRLGQELDRAVRGYVEGVLSGPEMSRERERIENQLAELATNEAAAHRRATVATSAVRGDILVQVGAIEQAWAKMSAGEKREVIKLLARRVVLRTGAVEIEWKSLEEIST